MKEEHKLLRNLRSVLAYHEALGISLYHRNNDIKAFCVMETELPPDRSDSGRVTHSPVSHKAAEKPGGIAESENELSLTDIESEVNTCTTCDLHKHRRFSVFGHGLKNVRLLIIGDWLFDNNTGQSLQHQDFGFEQDQMLYRMLSAIKIPREAVFVTNVIKCTVSPACHPAANHVQSCMSFLRRQITVLAPEMICTMGMIAARALLNQPQSLSQLRGTFHNYRTENERDVPVLTTYHPTYLLQNPEMKKATWTDLQLLARKMGLL